MRNKGSKNKRPMFPTHDRLNSKAAKANQLIQNFIDVSLRNQWFAKMVDYDLLHKVGDHLKELSTIKR